MNELADEIAFDNASEIVAKEVMPDHVHIFAKAVPTDAPAQVAHRFEGRTPRVHRGESAA